MPIWRKSDRRARERDAERRRLEEQARRKEELKRAKAERRPLWLTALATLVLAVVGILSLYAALGGFSDAEPDDGAVAEPTVPPATSPAPTPAADDLTEQEPLGTTVGLGCPSLHKGDPKRSLELRVVMWCANNAVRRQAQFKVKLWVDNTGQKPLDISLGHWYLLVDRGKLGDWTPPEVGTPATRRPVRIGFSDSRVWAVPANEERAFDYLPGNPYIGTFATHWGGTALDPGAKFHAEDPDHGNLVFYVPKRPEGPRYRIEDIIGIAYLDSKRVLAVCPLEQWGPRVASDDF